MAEAATEHGFTRVFVGGYMHSGTTMLARILGENSNLFKGLGEVKLFELLPLVRKRFPLDTDEQQQAFYRASLAAITNGAPHNVFAKVPGPYDDHPLPDDWASCPKSHVVIFFWACDHLAAEAGATHWMAKSPNFVVYGEQIFAQYPDALFVTIVRDPRDVLASKKTRVRMLGKKWSGERLQDKQLEKKYSPLLDAMSWAASYRAAVRVEEQHPDRTLTIRYESLLDDPDAAVKALCDFLDLEFQPAMLDLAFSNSAELRQNPSGIYQNAGKYRTTLSVPEIAFLQRLLKRQLAFFGYEPLAPISAADQVRSLRYLVTGLVDFVDRLLSRFRLLGWDGFVSYVTMSIQRITRSLRRTASR